MSIVMCCENREDDIFNDNQLVIDIIETESEEDLSCEWCGDPQGDSVVLDWKGLPIQSCPSCFFEVSQMCPGCNLPRTSECYTDDPNSELCDDCWFE